jgi:hypothetical protein
VGATLAGAAHANPDAPSSGRDRGQGQFDSESTLDRIPLILADNRHMTVLYLVLITLQEMLVFRTLNAVRQRNENRLPVARIPLINQIVRAPYVRGDFDILRQIAVYYLIGQSMLIDLRPRAQVEPVAKVDVDWDKIEAKLAAEAQTPVPGQILIDSPKVELSGAANTVTVFNRDSSYTMLLGGKAVSAAARQEALPFLSNLPLMGHMFSNGTVTRKDGELLVMVQPSIVERSWD